MITPALYPRRRKAAHHFSSVGMHAEAESNNLPMQPPLLAHVTEKQQWSVTCTDSLHAKKRVHGALPVVYSTRSPPKPKRTTSNQVLQDRGPWITDPR
jgi:hypothetical protein